MRTCRLVSNGCRVCCVCCVYLIIPVTSIVSAGLVIEGLKKAKIHCVEYLLCARWRVMVAEPESLGLSLVRHQRIRLPTDVCISEFSPLLDDHRMLQSVRVMKHIHLRLFDIRKGSG